MILRQFVSMICLIGNKVELFKRVKVPFHQPHMM